MAELTSSPKRSLPEPNPETRAIHRREVFRQITLPLIFMLLALIGAGIWAVWAGVGSIERWSQIATIFLAFFGLLIGLIVLAVFAALTFIVTQILRILPPYTRIAQDAIKKIDRQVKAGADIAVKPVIEVQRFLAVINVLFKRNKSDS